MQRKLTCKLPGPRHTHV